MSSLTRPLPRASSPAHWARLRLVSDEGLLRLVRSGDERAFDVLVRRYDVPLHAFCRHILGSREDAEDVMQETWSAAYRAMIRDDRQLTIRAWLYAIARNTCLNAMRTSGPRPTLVPVGVSDEEGAGGILHRLPTAHSAADQLADRERFRVLIGDIQELPENQRTALVLHELDALSYDEIAGVLDVSVGAVKSLLVRARLGLTESAEAREVDCDDVRLELAAVAQRVATLRAPTRAHVRNCEDCAQFSKRLKKTGRSLTAAIAPLPMIALWLQKIGLGKLTGGGVAAGTAGGATVIGAGGGAFTLKAAATVAAAALATAGAATEVHKLATPEPSKSTPASVKADSAVPGRPGVVTTGAGAPAAASSADDGAGASGKPQRAVTAEPLQDAAPSTAAASATSRPSAPTLRQGSAAVSVEASAKLAPSGRPAVQEETAVAGGRPTVSLPQNTVAPATQTPAPADPAAPATP